MNLCALGWLNRKRCGAEVAFWELSRGQGQQLWMESLFSFPVGAFIPCNMPVYLGDLRVADKPVSVRQMHDQSLAAQASIREPDKTGREQVKHHEAAASAAYDCAVWPKMVRRSAVFIGECHFYIANSLVGSTMRAFKSSKGDHGLARAAGNVGVFFHNHGRHQAAASEQNLR